MGGEAGDAAELEDEALKLSIVSAMPLNVALRSIQILLRGRFGN